MSVDEITDTLVRAARGEAVPPESLSAAQLGLDGLDDEGIARVLDRLRVQGMLDAVVDEGIIEDVDMGDMESRTEVVIPLAVLVAHGVSDGVVGAQVRHATEFYGRQGMRLSVIAQKPLSEPDTAAILSIEGQSDALEVNDLPDDHEAGRPAVERPAPGQEAEALLEQAWSLAPDATVSHAAFVPEFDGGEGINIDSDSYDTAHPGVVVESLANVTVLAHELGHHLDLEHVDRVQNMMHEESGGRFEDLEPGQLDTIRRSMRVRLAPRGEP